MRSVRAFALTFLGTLLLGGVFVGGYVAGAEGNASSKALPGFELFWQVQDLLSDRFSGELPDSGDQLYGATQGLVASYGDPYTIFVEPDPRVFERDELRGYFGGIGATLLRDEEGNLVLAVIRDRPAARAGVLDGDILLSVDGTPITPEMTVSQVALLVRGDVGSKVVLEIVRGDGLSFKVEVVRERIETPSVEWRVLDDALGIGYIKIRIFSERTSGELESAITELSAGSVDKVVLDLRGNGGGLLDAAIDTTSQFLHEGIVLRELRRDEQERFYSVKGVTTAAQVWEMAVLIDGGTASAAEIVAGALSDKERAVLIGEKSYGKGSVQEVHEFPDGSSLHVTVARWLTPNRQALDQAGLEPDIVQTFTPEEQEAGRDLPLERAVQWFQDQEQ